MMSLTIQKGDRLFELVWLGLTAKGQAVSQHDAIPVVGRGRVRGARGGRQMPALGPESNRR